MIARKIHLWVTEVGGLALVEAAWSVPVIPVTVTNVRFSYNFLKGQRFRSKKFKKSTLIPLQGAGEKVSELKALLRYEFTTAVRSVTVMVPPHGARSPGPAWLICVNISIIRSVAAGHRGQPLTANRATDQTEVSS